MNYDEDVGAPVVAKTQIIRGLAMYYELHEPVRESPMRRYLGRNGGSNAHGARGNRQFRGSFLVAVRLDAAGRVRALNDNPVPRRYADLFTEIAEHRFRLDISSSEIRARARVIRNT